MENKEQKLKKKIYKRWWFWVLAVIVFLFVIGSLGNSSNNQTSQTGNTEKSYNVGDLVPVEKTTWKIITAKDLGDILKSDNQFIDSKKTSGKFVKVSFEVTNNDTNLQSVGNLKVVDSNGREFTSSADVSYFIPNDESLFIMDNINPGITKRYTVIFDIPKDATGLKLQPGGAIMLKDVYINLGM